MPGIAAGPFDGETPRAGGAVHVDTAIVCAVVLLAGIVPGVAFMALLTAPFVALWLLVQPDATALKTRHWRYLATKIAALAATVGVLCASQAVYAPLARHAADDARQAVVDYHAAHGAWPRTLAEAGFHDEARLRRWHVVYFQQDGDFMYLSTFNGFDRWWRRHDDADWVFQPD